MMSDAHSNSPNIFISDSPSTELRTHFAKQMRCRVPPSISQVPGSEPLFSDGFSCPQFQNFLKLWSRVGFIGLSISIVAAG